MLSDTLPEWPAYRARSSPDRVALVSGGLRLTFAELDRYATVAARRLAAAGVGERTRVGALLPNGAAFVVLVHALTRLGAVLVPLSTRLAPPEIAYRLRDATPFTVIAGADAARDLEPSVGDVRIVDPADPDVLAGAPEAEIFLRDRVDLSAIQGIVYTSATSGRPKGAMLTYENHWWSAVGSALNIGAQPGDRWLAVLPLSHVGGLAILWRSVIFGNAVTLHERFDPLAVSEEVDRGEVTIVSLVPTMLHRLLEARGDRPLPATVRAVLVGGGPIPASLIERSLRAGVPISPTYGLTESASQVATLRPEEVPSCPGSCGQPLYPLEVRIDLPGTRSRFQEPGEVAGEILVRGPMVMAGYWGRPEETAEVLRDGWLRTGDIGYLDPDGNLYVLDRRDDLIVTAGENVYPAEVEAVMRQHPAVAEAAVVGLPDAEWGQVVVAAVETTGRVQVTEEQLRAFVGQHLARHKVPRRIRLVEALPRSGPDKVSRRAVREWISQEHPAAVPTGSHQDA